MHEREEDLCVPRKEMEVTEKNRCRVRKRPTCRKREDARWGGKKIRRNACVLRENKHLALQRSCS